MSRLYALQQRQFHFSCKIQRTGRYLTDTFAEALLTHSQHCLNNFKWLHHLKLLPIWLEPETDKYSQIYGIYRCGLMRCLAPASAISCWIKLRWLPLNHPSVGHSHSLDSALPPVTNDHKHVTSSESWGPDSYSLLRLIIFVVNSTAYLSQTVWLL